MTDREPRGYNPLDHEHRIERARERQLFFRQVGLFPAVAVAMACFSALALARPAWALPYLVYLMAACGLGAALQNLADGRVAAGVEDPETASDRPQGGLSAMALVAVATACLAPFVLVSAWVWPSVAVALVVVVGGIIVRAHRQQKRAR